MGLFIYIFTHKLEMQDVNSTKDCSQRKLNLFEIYWFIYGAILRQGSNLEIKSNGLRILFGTWWLFVVVLTSLYTGGLTAFMTQTETKLLINTLDDLASRSNAKWVTVGGTALESYIKVK